MKNTAVKSSSETKHPRHALAVPILTALMAWCVCSPAPAADRPPDQSKSEVSAQQQKRIDAMKSRGPDASLTILPVMVGGKAFDRVNTVVACLLENMGLQQIELGKTPFKAGIKTEAGRLSVLLGEFLSNNPVTTEYALYAEYNGSAGAGLDEVQAIVLDKTGVVVWTDRQTTQDEAFKKVTDRDPMGLSVFLVERLSPHLGLNDETAKKATHRMQDAFDADRGLPPWVEREERMPTRVQSMKKSKPWATLMVRGVRINRDAKAQSVADLTKLIGEAGLFKAVPAKEPLLLNAAPNGPDEGKYLWALAREFQKHAKTNPVDADYVLYADYAFNAKNWQQGFVHFVICDRQGEWVIVDFQNSEGSEYQRIKPIARADCDQVIVGRLRSYLHNPVATDAAPTATQVTANAGPAGHWEADITGDGSQRIRVTLALAKNAKSEWSATMGVPSANMTSLTVKDLVVNGNSVKFVAVDFMMAAFELTLAPDGSMKGTISGPGAQPVEFKRTGQAKVKLPPTNPAVSKELEGAWAGLIVAPNGSANVVFHFKNQPDKTVTATFDDDTRVGVPVSNVKQTGQQVEFEAKAEHAKFQGRLNKEGTELAGQLTIGPNPTPLTLRKKNP